MMTVEDQMSVLRLCPGPLRSSILLIAVFDEMF